MEAMEVMEVSAGPAFIGEVRASYGTAPRGHRDLKVYRRAFELAMEVSTLTRSFPKEELYCLIPPLRRPARSVHANIAEEWRKRRYQGPFVAKLSDSESEAAETQSWLESAFVEGYIDERIFERLVEEYEKLLATIVGIINHSDKWVLKPTRS